MIEDFALQGWNKSLKQFLDYYTQQENDQKMVIIAQVDGNVAGYVILLKSAKSGPYILQKIPEIVDLNVLIKYRNTGVGNRIMDVAEKLAHKGAAGKGSGVCTPHRFTVNANVI